MTAAQYAQSAAVMAASSDGPSSAAGAPLPARHVLACMCCGSTYLLSANMGASHALEGTPIPPRAAAQNHQQRASNVTTGLGNSTLDAMGVQSTHQTTYLRKAYVNSSRLHGLGADDVPLEESEHTHLVPCSNAAALPWPQAGE